MASETALKFRSRSKMSVTSEIRSMNTNERILRKASWSAWRTERKNTLALVTLVETSQSTKISGRRGRRGRYLRTTGTPPVSSEARMVRRTSTWAWRWRPLSSWPWVASRRLSWATTRWTAARSCSGPLGSARSSSLSGREGGRVLVRSMRSRSSSRRRCASKRRSASRSRPSRRGSPSGSSGWGSAFRPRARRMRWTSTPMTPEPAPRLPKAAMASRARSRMAASDPSRRAAAICWRSVSRFSSSASSPAAASAASCSEIPRRTASASAARKKKRSKTSSKTRRSSWDLASVAAKASRRSAGSAQPISARTAKASSSSLVPMATPSERSSSPKRSSWASNPPGAGSGSAAPARLGGAGKLVEAHAHPLGHDVEIGAVLDDDRHRVAERGPVDVLGAEQQQRAGPVDRLGDRRRLLQVERADLPDDLHELAGHRLRQLGRVQTDDGQLVLDLRVVQPQIEAAALERLGELARVVRGQQHHGLGPGVDPPELGNRDLEVRQEFEEHGLELLVGLVDLVDEQHHRVGGGDGGHERAGEEELLAEDVVLHGLPARLAGLGLDAQQLLAVVPLVQRLGLVQALVALQADQRAAEVAAERLGQLGLAHAR